MTKVKNLNTQQNLMAIVEETSDIGKIPKESIVICPFKNASTFVCINRKCTHNAFICQQLSCQCQKHHLRCMKIDTKTFLQNGCQKIVDLKKFQQLINSKIESFNGSIQNMRKEILRELYNNFRFLQILNQEKFQFQQADLQKEMQQMNGQKVWTIISNFPVKQQVIEMAEICQQTIQKHFQDLNKYFQEFQQKLTKQIENCSDTIRLVLANIKPQKQFVKSKLNFSAFDSKVVKTFFQLQTLLGFFETTQPESAKLLYRASQNNFQVKKFHQKCDGIPHTLTLIQTNANKKIGGYTPIPWKSRYPSNVQDQTLRTFIFSITEGDKFVQKNSFNSLYHSSNLGPTFGGRCDLYLVDNANNNKSSYAQVNFFYGNLKYKFDDRQSWLRFSGNKNCTNFSTIQWQVWALDFGKQNQNKK